MQLDESAARQDVQLQQLKGRLQQAVAAEDYATAMALEQEVDDMTARAERLQELKDELDKAIAAEDYQRATVIKRLLDEMAASTVQGPCRVRDLRKQSKEVLAREDYAAAAGLEIEIEKAANCAETSSGHDAAGEMTASTVQGTCHVHDLRK